MSDWIGKTLGKVHIDLLLARGGMAEVYLGMHTTLKRPVAVKLLKNQFQDDPDLLDRFQREARVVAMLRHPNIVQVLDFDTINSHPYLVMEYVPGVSLATYLSELHSKDQKLELLQVKTLIDELADALQYAHETGIIHRDIKPSNILLTSRSVPVEKDKPLPADVQPVLTDFGLVRFLNSPRQTVTGVIAGTPAYMSPEQARGEITDARADVYSLGVVLYEMLANKVPFEADSTLGVLMKHINEPPPPIAGLSYKLQQVIDRALEKNPEDRFQTPVELSQAFDAAIREQSEADTLMPAGSGSERFEHLTRPKSAAQSRLPIYLGAVFLLLIGMALAFKPFGLSRILPGSPEDHQANSNKVNAVADGQPVGLLRFQDGAALVDKVTVTALSMPQPANGTQYEAWLLGADGEQRRSLGVLNVDPSGKGTVTFVDPQGNNLLAAYDSMEITIEPKPDSNPNPSENVAYAATLPSGGLIHVRHLLVSFSNTPGKIGLVDGLLNDSQLLDKTAQNMLTAYQAGNEADVRKNAETMLNLLVGRQSADHKDWDKDGQITDPSDGFGMLLNGDSVGYIEGSFSHAGYAASAPDATGNMKVHGGHVQISTQNLEGWAPKLRDLLEQILASPFDNKMEQSIRQAVSLSDEILKGIDLNGNEQVEPIPGEGGAETAYDHAYYMADMAIYPTANK